MPDVDQDFIDSIHEAQAQLIAEHIDLLRSIRNWLVGIWLTLAVICGTLIQLIGHNLANSGYPH